MENSNIDPKSFKEAILIKELKQDFDKNKKPYIVVIDGFNNRWNLFNINHKLELNKGYLFCYTKNGEYKNVTSIVKLDNVFTVQALKEMASMAEFKKDISVCLSYSVDLVVGGKLPIESLFSKTDDLHSYLVRKANDEYEKLNPVPEKKDIK